MTASLLKSEVDNCLAAGMNNYIPKPYQPKELIGPIYEVLKKNTIA
ncbi:MAG: CheY-like chemotaxis protein [Vicingaceae bacterium]|jgi:CheY-like chemotaxis protein